jgi:hypothetical protein
MTCGSGNAWNPALSKKPTCPGRKGWTSLPKEALLSRDMGLGNASSLAAPTGLTGGARGGGSAAMDAAPKPKEDPMSKLSRTQQQILETAAARPGGAVLPLPETLDIERAGPSRPR